MSDAYPRFFKRLVDLAIAALLIPIIAPVVTILWFLVRLDGGPGFFLHRRVGHKGRLFDCVKLRTMVPDAKTALKAHLRENPEARAEWERDYKLTDDPRITPIGRFLRKTSLDELPQVWNVLMGEMGFVGPRPITQEELKNYSGCEWCFDLSRPGITGLWQVSGRNDVSYPQRVAMDVEYVANQSVLYDLAIMWKTGSAIINRTGK